MTSTLVVSKQALTSLDTFLSEARRLQSSGSKTGVQFMRFLFLGEKHPKLWEGYRSFLQVIEVSNLCPTRKYLDFKAAHTKLTPKQVELFGVEGSIEVAKIENPEDLRTAVRAVQAWAIDNNAIPNRQRVGSILRKALSHLQGSSFVRTHEWLPIYSRGRKVDAQWCNCCGTIMEKTSAGVPMFTKPGWVQTEDTPPCVRVRTKPGKQLTP